MISCVRDAEAQVQQRVPPTSHETYSQKGTGQEGRDIDGGPVSAKARHWISPVLRDLWEESDVQSGYPRLEDLHRLPQHSTRQKPEPVMRRALPLARETRVGPGGLEKILR